MKAIGINFILLFFTTLVVGCSSPIPLTPTIVQIPIELTAKPSQSVTPTHQILRTNIAASTPVFSTTISPTVQPSSTIAPSQPVTFTPYPIATLSLADLQRKFDVLDEKPGCQLPCWNGLTPGESLIGEVQGFFARLGVNTNYVPIGGAPDVGFTQGDTFSKLGNVSVIVFWNDKVVNEIDIRPWSNMAYYSVKRIATVLGTPERIKVGGYGERMPYTVFFIYDVRHMYISINGYGRYRQPIDQKIPFEVCLSDTREQWVEIDLYSETTVGQVNVFLKDIDDWPSELGISTQELFDQLQKPNTCVAYH